MNTISDIQLLIFRLRDEDFGIEIAAIHEITKSLMLGEMGELSDGMSWRFL